MSLSIASILRDKIPYIIRTTNPFVSTVDINKADLWNKVLEKELTDADFGIVCVTRSNIRSPWLNFEAGVLSRDSRLAPLLFFTDPAHLRGGPLERFQSTVYERSDIFSLLSSINNRLPLESQVALDQLKADFDPWWIELDQALQEVAAQHSRETETGYGWLYTIGDLKRTVADLTSRCIMVVSPSPERDFNLFFVRDLIRINLERGVSYSVLIAESTGANEMEVIEDAFSSHPDQLSLTPIPDGVFEPLAVTHCCLINYERDSTNLRVFLELPVNEQTDQIEQTYWIEVAEFAARRFARRFRDLRDEYGRRPPLQSSASIPVTSIAPP
jgi:hypothetical protein